MPADKYVEENGLAAMLTKKRSAGVTPKVNLRECVIYTSPPSMNKAAHSGLKTQRRCHQKGYQKGLVSSKKLFWKTTTLLGNLNLQWFKICWRAYTVQFSMNSVLFVCFIMVVYEKILLEALPSYVDFFPIYLRMALIVTNFPTANRP